MFWLKWPVLINPGFLTFYQKLTPSATQVSPLLTHLIRNRAQGRGLLASPSRCEKAAPSLAGGGRLFSEGLEYSCRPCARVLSVAGFLAFIALFPGPGRFILAGKEGGFPCPEASPLQPHGNK